MTGAAQDRPWTPGPWRIIEPVALDYRAPLVYGADQESLVASAEGGGPKRAITGAEARANAFLIAAAPELYEAAKIAFDFLDNWEPGAPGWTDATEELRAALSKALGKRP